MRLPQPEGPGFHIYIPQEQGGPVIPPGTEFPLRRILRLAGGTLTLLQPGRPGPCIYISLRNKMASVQSQNHVMSDGPGRFRGALSERTSIRHQGGVH
jgi:hypothetical protein